jgi:hypothetical protein
VQVAPLSKHKHKPLRHAELQQSPSVLQLSPALVQMRSHFWIKLLHRNPPQQSLFFLQDPAAMLHFAVTSFSFDWRACCSWMLAATAKIKHAKTTVRMVA